MSDTMTISALLAAPATFDGREVAVRGFFIAEREHVALYESPADTHDPALGVWLSHPATTLGKAGTLRLNRSWVDVVGTFHNRHRAGAGHFGGWPAELSGIKSITVSTTPGDNA